MSNYRKNQKRPDAHYCRPWITFVSMEMVRLLDAGQDIVSGQEDRAP